MKTNEETLAFLLKKLPMPKDCRLFGESSFHETMINGLAVKRTLEVDVSKRIPKGIRPYGGLKIGSDDEIFYLTLTEELISEMWGIFSNFLDIEAERFDLTAERNEDTVVYLSADFSVTIRARFGHIDGRKTYWCIDFVAVVRTESK